MKLVFNGWRRTVYPHEFKAMPVTGYGYSTMVGKAGQPLQWDNATTVRARINRMALTGDFKLTMQFEIDELKNWLSVYVKEHPEDAIRMLASFQAEAVIALANKASASSG